MLVAYKCVIMTCNLALFSVNTGCFNCFTNTSDVKSGAPSMQSTHKIGPQQEAKRPEPVIHTHTCFSQKICFSVTNLSQIFGDYSFRGYSCNS